MKTPNTNKVPRFGETVCWYRHAALHNEPQLATVYKAFVESNGSVSLTVVVTLKDSERPPVWYSGVRHVTDPVLQERPRGANIAKSCGGFEHVDEMEARMEEARRRQQERVELERLEREEKAELAARAAEKETVKV